MLFDGTGRPRRAVSAALDVPEQREAARAVQRTAQLLAEAQRIGKMGSFNYDVVEDRVSWSVELADGCGAVANTLARVVRAPFA